MSAQTVPAYAPPPANPGPARAIVLTTVLAWNTLVAVALIVATTIIGHSSRPTGGEDWTGVVLLIVLAVGLGAVLVSTITGIIIAVARTGRPGWPSRPMSTGRAIAVGSGHAAWGLGAFVVVPLLLVLLSSISAWV